MENLHTWHILGERLRSDAHAPQGALRFGARCSLQTALKYESFGTQGVIF